MQKPHGPKLYLTETYSTKRTAVDMRYLEWPLGYCYNGGRVVVVVVVVVVVMSEKAVRQLFGVSFLIFSLS